LHSGSFLLTRATVGDLKQSLFLSIFLLRHPGGLLPEKRLRLNALDKQIAATALIYDLTVVTRNRKDFVKTGVAVLNPFSA